MTYRVKVPPEGQSIFEPMSLDQLHYMRVQFEQRQQQVQSMRSYRMAKVWKHRALCALALGMMFFQGYMAAHEERPFWVWMGGYGAGVWSMCAYWSWMNARHFLNEYRELLESVSEDISRITAAIKAKGNEHGN